MPENSNNKSLETSVPVVPIRDVLVFPHMIAPLLITREASVKALEKALDDEKNDVILVAQKDPLLESPESTDLYDYGMLVKVIQVLKFPDGTIKAIVEGISRVKINAYEQNNSVVFANISEIQEVTPTDTSTKALVRLAVDRFESYIKKSNRMSSENFLVLSSLDNDPGKLADVMATYLELDANEKQQVLETSDAQERLELMSKILEREMEMLNIEEVISNRLRINISKTQREFYLREKLRVIKEELHDKDDVENELDEYKARIEELEIPEKYKTKLKKEISRLDKMPVYSTEIGVIKTYLDRVLGLPWNKSTKDVNDIDRAQKILDEDHWGLKDVKERIIEFLAVRQLTKKKQATIICLVGPPGVGKSSLAKSIARSLKRKFSYISLGGINDESEIRGHRRTYVGSMPGRIIQAIENAGTRNPVILLDEIEKMMRSHMGDPTAAMLEVLDPEQNVTFSDHYIDIPFDLSEVFFIATANTLDNIYKALRDRLEVITISGYTEEEKLNIAKHFLVPKQLQKHGISKPKLKISDPAIVRIINEYTKEAGVRNLERTIAKICRKVATEIIRKEKTSVSVSEKNLETYLGIPKYTAEDKRNEDEIGVINGLAWTEYGGDVLHIEATLMPGKGKLNLTGSLGDVMQESAKAAMGFIRSNHDKFNLPSDLREKYDVHVHLPDGATPKDGPSAGLAITLAIISALSKKPLRADIAVTGEITLRGKVLPIGGLKEKVLAALRNDIYKIVIPEKNRKDVSELPDYVKEKVEFIYVRNIEQVLKDVFTDAE